MTYCAVTRAAEFVSLLVARSALLCSGADGGKRLPSNDVRGAQLTALSPHLRRVGEGERREREVQKMEQSVSYSCENMRATESHGKVTHRLRKFTGPGPSWFKCVWTK